VTLLNETIELHDSIVGAVSQSESVVVLSLSPFYVHRSPGRPDTDGSTVWLQDGTLTIMAASVSATIELPATISDGSLRIGEELHSNSIPAAGTFAGPIELQLLFDTAETLAIRGERITIALHGEASYLEDFEPER
jgi:hypothetical protein